MQRDLGSVLDIVLACRDIEDFVRDFEPEDFLRDRKTRYAVIHQIQVIGEATKRLSTEFRDSHGSVPWKAMAGMRDRLIHAYDEVDYRAVWRVATVEVPDLRAQLEFLVPSGPQTS